MSERASGAAPARPISRLIGSDGSGMVIVFVFKQRRASEGGGKRHLSPAPTSLSLSRARRHRFQGERRAETAKGPYTASPRRIDVGETEMK